jgi:hypothetical protein
MKLRIATVVGAVLALSIAAFAQNVRRDGKWEIKMEMEMPGLPAGMPPMTTEQCITPAEANDPQKMAPPMGRGRGGRGGGNCTVSDYKVDGNKVTYSMKCTGEQPMSGTGEFLYAADSYTGVMTMDMGGRGTMKMKSTGKRLGDCVK